MFERRISRAEFLVITVLCVCRSVIETGKRFPVLFLQGGKHRPVFPDEAQKNQLYAIVPVDDDDLAITPELAAKIEKARQEFREEKAISLKTHEDVDRYFDSM